jgi:hypothetical protein
LTTSVAINAVVETYRARLSSTSWSMAWLVPRDARMRSASSYPAGACQMVVGGLKA